MQVGTVVPMLNVYMQIAEMRIGIRTIWDKEENMASSREYLEYILEQLSKLDNISYRAMMGEYVLYYRGKVFGGIYDDRFLVKNINAASEYMPEAELEVPYPTGKPMLLVDNVDSREYVCGLVDSMYGELPEIKRRK